MSIEFDCEGCGARVFDFRDAVPQHGFCCICEWRHLLRRRLFQRGDAMERETAAINAERIDGHEMPRMYRQEKERMARAVLSAIAPRLRAQGAVVGRRDAKPCASAPT